MSAATKTVMALALVLTGCAAPEPTQLTLGSTGSYVSECRTLAKKVFGEWVVLPRNDVDYGERMPVSSTPTRMHLTIEIAEPKITANKYSAGLIKIQSDELNRDYRLRQFVPRGSDDPNSRPYTWFIANGTYNCQEPGGELCTQNVWIYWWPAEVDQECRERMTIEFRWGDRFGSDGRSHKCVRAETAGR